MQIKRIKTNKPSLLTLKMPGALSSRKYILLLIINEVPSYFRIRDKNFQQWNRWIFGPLDLMDEVLLVNSFCTFFAQFVFN